MMFVDRRGVQASQGYGKATMRDVHVCASHPFRVMYTRVDFESRTLVLENPKPPFCVTWTRCGAVIKVGWWLYDRR